MLESSFSFDFAVDLNATVGGSRTSASFDKSSLKHTKSFRIISFNQKLARALTSTPQAIA